MVPIMQVVFARFLRSILLPVTVLTKVFLQKRLQTNVRWKVVKGKKNSHSLCRNFIHKH